MRAAAIIVIVYLLMGLESPLLHELHLVFYAPDVALISVIYVGASFPTSLGLVVSFVIGILKDGFVMGAPVGMYAEIYLIVFIAVKQLSTRAQVRTTIPLLGVTFAASLLSSVLFFFFMLIFDSVFDDFVMIFYMMLPQAVISAPFAPLVALLLGKVDTTFGRSKRDKIFQR